MAESILFKRGKYSQIAGLSVKSSNAIYFGMPDDDNHIGALWVGDKVIANTTKIADVQWDKYTKDSNLELEMESTTVPYDTWTAEGWEKDSDKYFYYIKLDDSTYKQVLETDSSDGYTTVNGVKTSIAANTDKSLYLNAKGSYLYIGTPTASSGVITYTKVTISSGTTVESLSSEISTLATRVANLETKVSEIDSSITSIKSSISDIQTEQTTQNASIGELSKAVSANTDDIGKNTDAISVLNASVGYAGTDATNTSTGLYAKIDEALSTAISKSEVELTSGEDALVYTLTQNGQTVGTINIPKDQFLDNVEYYKTAESGVTNVEAPYIKFTWKLTGTTAGGDTAITRISVADLVDTYTAGDSYVSISDDRKITLNLDTVKTALNIPVTKVESDSSAIEITTSTDGNTTTYKVGLIWAEETASAGV